MKITDAELSDLRGKHPRGIKILIVAPAAPEGAEGSEGDEGDEFVFRVVDRAEYTRYRSASRKALLGQGPSDAATLAARSLLLWPDVGTFDALREKAPAIVEEFGEILLADADAGLTVREGKR
jgi:hypothetical protein